MHVDTTSSTATTQTIHRKMCDAIVEFVQVMNIGDMLLVSLLNALQYNKIRAEVCPLCVCVLCVLCVCVCVCCVCVCCVCYVCVCVCVCHVTGSAITPHIHMLSLTNFRP